MPHETGRPSAGLDILAAIHSLQPGRVSTLPGGIFDLSLEPVVVARARSVGLLLRHVRPGSGVLDLGHVLAGAAALLEERGCRSVPLAAGQPLNVVGSSCQSYEGFHEREGSWDLLSCCECGRELPMLALFERAEALLQEQGEILALDEFALRYATPGADSRYHKGHFLALAERFGFTCEEVVDLSDEVRQSLDVVVSALQSHEETLAAMTGADRAQLHVALDRVLERRRLYAGGMLGYFLLRLRRTALPRWRLARIAERDQPAVSRLFREAFGHELTPAMWRWKYGSGRGAAIGVWQDDRLIAHYGGFPRQFVHEGVQVGGCQKGDLMVAANRRGLLLRRGPLFEAAATFTEQYIGYGRRYLLPFGFPNQRSFGLLNRLGIFSAPVGRIMEAIWPAMSCRWSSLRMRELDPELPADAGVIDALWEQMAAELSPLYVGVRNAGYCRERYRDHPENRYRILLVSRRWRPGPLAVLVVKTDGERLELLDWIAASERIPLVIDSARRLAAESGCNDVYLWASDPVLDRLAATAPRLVDHKIAVPYNSWTDGPPREEFVAKLWLTGGDADFH